MAKIETCGHTAQERGDSKSTPEGSSGAGFLIPLSRLLARQAARQALASDVSLDREKKNSASAPSDVDDINPEPPAMTAL